MHIGRLLLRITVGATFFVHGTQKLFGCFGGYGLDGTGQFLSLGLRPGKRNAVAAGRARGAAVGLSSGISGGGARCSG